MTTTFLSEEKSMTDKKRNQSELTLGEAVGRIVDIRGDFDLDLSAARLEAERKVRERFESREAAVLARVPEEIRELVLAKARAAMTSADTAPAPELDAGPVAAVGRRR
jgi:hypothetical protein